MDTPRVELARTELAFLQRLLLEAQGRLQAEGEHDMVSAIELALAMLHWDGESPPALDAQVGLGAAVQLKLGPDAMCAYRQWPASTDNRIVPSTSRFRGAFALVYRSGQSFTQFSNSPLVCKNSMKKAICPRLLTSASGAHLNWILPANVSRLSAVSGGCISLVSASPSG